MLPHPRSHQEVDIHSHLTTLALPLSHGTDDVYEWIVGDSFCVFTALLPHGNLFSKTRYQKTGPTWSGSEEQYQSIHSQCESKNYDRLPTGAHLAGWGMLVSSDCWFCSRAEESRDHLLLSYEYSQAVWHEVLIRCQPPPSAFINWAELLSWIKAPTSRRLTLLRKLAAQTVVFHIWKQINILLHNQSSIPVALVFHGIDKELRNIINTNA